MTTSLRRAGIALTIGGVALSLVLAAVAPASTTAATTATPGALPASGEYASGGAEGAYLALGDSVPFGYDPTLTPSTTDASQFVGYPELAAPKLHLALTNFACPGQASGGFLNLTGFDNGCFLFRAHFALHAPYAGSQLQAAVDFLRANPDTRLVTIMLGANDLLLCVRMTGDGCASELPVTVATVASNLATALTAIRNAYRGQLVVVTYYSTDFSNPATTVPIQTLDAALAAVAERFGGRTADGYAAFEERSADFGGSACAAGLLIRLSNGSCDIHPSPKGDRLLARTVVAAMRQHDGSRL